MTSSKELVTPAVEDDKALAEAIAGTAEYDAEITDPEEVSRAILEKILNASDESELSSVSGGTTHAEDVIGLGFIIHAVHFNRSDFENGPSVYAVADVKLVDTGESLAVTCGSRNVMAALLKLREFGLPTKGSWRIVRSDRPTTAGFYPMWLQKVPV